MVEESKKGAHCTGDVGAPAKQDWRCMRILRDDCFDVGGCHVRLKCIGPSLCPSLDMSTSFRILVHALMQVAMTIGGSGSVPDKVDEVSV